MRAQVRLPPLSLDPICVGADLFPIGVLQMVAINKAREEAQRTLDSVSGAGTPAPVPAVVVAEQKEQSVQEKEESSEAAAVARATL